MKFKGTPFLFVLLFSCSVSMAQRSMMDEVSVPYLDTLIMIAKNSYPGHKIFTKQIGISEHNLNRVKLSWFDGLGVYYLYVPPANSQTGTGINPVTSRNGLQLGFQLNIGSLLYKPAQINAAKGDRDVAILDKEVDALKIEADVKERYYKYIQQVAIMKQLSQMLLDAQTMLTSVRSKFERGQEPFESYSRALVYYNEQNQAKINIEAELLIAKARLEELLNQKLENIKIK